MPRGDRSGPEGMGPMTGRSLGYCAGNDRPGYQADAVPTGRGFGRGFGRGWGFGRRRGNGFGYGYGYGFGRRLGGFGPAVDSPVEQETSSTLAAEVARLKEQLQALEERLGNSDNVD